MFDIVGTKACLGNGSTNFQDGAFSSSNEATHPIPVCCPPTKTTSLISFCIFFFLFLQSFLFL